MWLIRMRALSGIGALINTLLTLLTHSKGGAYSKVVLIGKRALNRFIKVVHGLLNF